MSLFEELKRRNVVRVGIAYVIVGWLAMQITDVMAPALYLPEWTESLVAFLLLLGFPIALFLAWAFELTPEGLRREADVDRTASITRRTGRKLNALIGTLAVCALAYFGWSQLTQTPEDTASSAATREGATPSPSQAAPSGRDKSIAVLPFQNRSAAAENAAFFADGVHDELLTNLSKIGELKVISRTSVMQYRDTTKTMREIGDELAVATLLEGGVQRAGDTVRINVQLIDATTDEHLWAESYDRELTPEDIFAVQSDIARSIADALKAALSPAEAARIAQVPTSSLDAYEHYLLATQLKERANWDALERGLVEIDRAIAIDPDFSEAYAFKASLMTNLVATGARTLDEIRLELEQALEEALGRDPDSPVALGAKAEVLWTLGDEAGFRATIEAALRKAPNSVSLLQSAAYGATLSGDPEWAMEQLLHARELDPLSTQVLFNVARTNASLGRPEEALAAYQRIRDIDPSSARGMAPMTGPLSVQGKLDEALYWLMQSMKADHLDLDHWGWIARIYMDLGDLETAASWLDGVAPGDRDYAMVMAARARLEVERGQEDAGLALARRYLEAGTGNRWGSTEVMVSILLRDAARQNDASVAMALLADAFPELFQPEPSIEADNVMQAIDLAHLHLINGDRTAADRLLTSILAFTETPYALTGDHNLWRVTARAQALALRGERPAALAELQRLVDSGWRLMWRWETELNPNFDALSGDPAYQALLEQLDRDSRRLSASVTGMEARGDLLAAQEVTPR